MKKLNTNSKTKKARGAKEKKIEKKVSEVKEVKVAEEKKEVKENKKVETKRKVVMGIIIPYYNNSLESEIAFKRLMQELSKQMTNDMIMYVYEDGQTSDWLLEYANENIIIKSSKNNEGVSHARNMGIDYLIDKVNYILFIDADDIVESNYLPKMCEYCADNTHEIIESSFLVNGTEAMFNRNVIRSGVAGSALQTKIIGDVRFEENMQIGEDTNFMHKVVDLSKYRKKHAPTQYIYQLGLNAQSLTKRFERKEIGKER